MDIHPPPPPLNIEIGSINKNMGRILEYRELTRQIRPLLRILNKSPETEMEIAIMSEDKSIMGDGSELSSEIIEKAKALLEELKGKVDAQADRAKALWSRVLSNWEHLNEERDLSLEYANSRSDIIQMLENLCNEQENAGNKRLQCIHSAIIEIREELVELWKQCMATAEERENFEGFRSTNFTKELLDLHKAELVRWKYFHKKNQNVFAYIEKRQNLWKRMRELQAKAEDPNRFINRGGALLQSQKEMNYVSAALPKCEEKLIKLANNFEKENGRKVLILGKKISEVIAEDWAQHRESIRNRSSKPLLNKPSVVQDGMSQLTRSACKLTGEKRAATSRATILVKKGRLNPLDLGLDLAHDQTEDQENNDRS